MKKMAAKKKKKILIIASCPLADDGLTKIEMDVIREFRHKADFEVACAFGFDNQYGTELKRLHIPMHVLSPKKDAPQYMKSIEHVILEREIDVAYIHGNSALMAMEALPAHMTHRCKVVTHCHNTKSNHPLVHYLSKPLFNQVVDVKIGCSDLAAKWAYFGENIVVIPNGIDTNLFRFDSEKRTRTRQKLGIGGEPLIGHVGRFAKQKNHQRMIDIFKVYKETNPDAKLLLIGDGERRPYIKKYVQGKGLAGSVIFLKHTDYVQIYMDAMDVMVMPSLYEGFGLVALEAQAMGLPVVISDQFPKEVKVTPNIVFENLTASDACWVEKIDHFKPFVHYQISEETRQKMDYKSMMNQIEAIILS